MRFMPTSVHGLLDYAVGVFLIFSPEILGFNNAEPMATLLPRLLGVLAIIYSLFTQYERGAVRILPMPAHLALDFLSGVLLAASPWLFDFAGQVWAPHLLLGLFEIAASLNTEAWPRFVLAPGGRVRA